MVYITQLIYLREGKEELFFEFENFAIPLMEKYGGKLMYRVRPEREHFVSAIEELPFEIHIVSFDSEADLGRFMKDDGRQAFIHLKEASVRSVFMFKGEKM